MCSFASVQGTRNVLFLFSSQPLLVFAIQNFLNSTSIISVSKVSAVNWGFCRKRAIGWGLVQEGNSLVDHSPRLGAPCPAPPASGGAPGWEQPAGLSAGRQLRDPDWHFAASQTTARLLC